MKNILLFSALALSNYQAHAIMNTQSLAHSALQFIARDQIARTGSVYEAGEWPSDVTSLALPAAVGVGRLFRGEAEPSAFSTASVANELAVIYRQFPQFKQIPRLILRSLPTFERYREGYLYNFYPPKMWRGVRVHQAATMSLHPRWKGFTNIPPDSDTSSAVYTARYYAAALTGKSFALPRATQDSFATFRDQNRKSHYYNKQYGDVETGAYMTWQFDENDPDMPHYYFAQPEEGARIPFNRNDIDCVVNMNVLRLAALSGDELPGRKNSCQWLKKISEQGQYASCGIYYPNPYNFAYSAAMMDLAGESCLRSQYPSIVKHILGTRSSSDGAWATARKGQSDRVQATAFAMVALAHFGDFRDQNTRLAMRYGANFLYRQKKLSSNGDVYWRGEVFFTDTAIARSLVNWRADSFTTAVAVQALLEANRRTGWEPRKALDN